MLISVGLSATATLPFKGFGPFISLTRIVAIPMLFFWITYRAGDLKFKKWHPTFPLGVLFYLWIWVTILWTPNIDYAPIVGLIPFSGFVIAFIAWDLVRTQEEAQAVVQALIYGMCLTFLYMLLQYFKGNEYYNNRFGGAAFDPNEVAFYCMILLPIAWYMGNLDRKYLLFNRFLNLAYPGIAFAILLLTGSRGGFIISIPAFIYVFVTLKRGLKNPLARRPLQLALSISAVAGGILVAKSGIAKFAISRFSGIASHSDNMSGRLVAWQHALHLWSQHLFFGMGLAGFRYYSVHVVMEGSYETVGDPVHNTLLGILTDYGLIGFAIYVAVLVSIIALARTCEKNLRLALYFFMFVFVLGSMDISEELRQQFYVFLFAVVGLGYTMRDQAIRDYLQSLRPIGAIRRIQPRVTASQDVE